MIGDCFVPKSNVFLIDVLIFCSIYMHLPTLGELGDNK